MAEFIVGWKHPAPTFLWEAKRDTDPDWVDVKLLTGYASGELTDTLVIDSATTADAGVVRCTLSNAQGGSTPTRSANLTVGSISFVVHPTDLTLSAL